MKLAILITASCAVLTLAGTAAAGDAAAGKAKAGACAACHGANGEGKAKYPAIAGLDEKTFVQDMKDYKSGKKANGMMKSAASKLSDEDFENLAAHYHSLKK
jgi:cytochrome c553